MKTDLYQVTESIPLPPRFQGENFVFGVFMTLLFTGLLLLAPSITWASEVPREGRGFDLCALERDYSFFTGTPERGGESAPVAAQVLTCEEIMQLGEVMTADLLGGDTLTENKTLATELARLLAEHPMADMAGAIARYDREIAGLIVGIGKKESNWGKRTPKLSGEECFNYWGYRGAGDRGLTTDGYGCWQTREAAVKTIGDRLIRLREQRSGATPERMIVWKCGSSCAGHSPESVRKWIADVNYYYRTIAIAPSSVTRP